MLCSAVDVGFEQQLFLHEHNEFWVYSGWALVPEVGGVGVLGEEEPSDLSWVLLCKAASSELMRSTHT